MLMHWCNFCQTYHSSASCYHPGRPASTPGYAFLANKGLASFGNEMKHPHEMTDEKLIRAVAEDVMGGRENNYFFSEEHGLAFGPIPNDPQHRLQVWNPLTNANHRDMVVGRLHELGWYAEFNNRVPSGTWSIRLYKYQEPNNPVAINGNLGRAVCEAALEATKT